MDLRLAFIIIASIIGMYNFIKVGLVFQSAFRQELQIETKDVRALYIRLILNSLLLGFALGSLLVDWENIGGSWIALPCFSIVFLFGSIRFVRALKS
jgi:hypothetical protein